MWHLIQNMNMPQAKKLWKMVSVSLSVRQIHHSREAQNRLYLGDRELYSLMVQVIWEAPQYLLREWLIRYEDKRRKIRKNNKKREPPNAVEIWLFWKMHELQLYTWS